MDQSLQSLLPRFESKTAQLRHLEKVLARYGSDAPLDLPIKYDILRREVAILEQIRALRPKRGTEIMAGRVTLKFKLRQLFALEEPIIESLADFSQTLTELTDELPGIQPPASVAARQRIDQGHTSYASLAREWHDLQPIARAPASKVYTLIYQLNDAYAQLHLLELRHIHRRNLDIVEQQLATHQKNPLVDEVRASLQHMIDHEQRAIQKLERQRWQSASDQELLATHRRNLQWCQEMLAGARPVVPVKKLHELSAEEKAIREIDQQLALSHSL